MNKLSARYFKTIITISCLVLLTMSSSTAWACKCRVSKTPAVEMKKNDVVFLGKVVEEIKAPVGTHPKKWASRRPFYEYHMQVEKEWKGVYGKFIYIQSGGGGGDCGYGRLKIGQRLLIYASQYKQASTVADDSTLPTLTVCSRTKPAESAQDDIRSLDAIIEAR